MKYYTVWFQEDSDNETVFEFCCTLTVKAADPVEAINDAKDYLIKVHPILANTFNWDIVTVHCRYVYSYHIRCINTPLHEGHYTEEQLDDLRLFNVCLNSYNKDTFYNRHRKYYDIEGRCFKRLFN